MEYRCGSFGPQHTLENLSSHLWRGVCRRDWEGTGTAFRLSNPEEGRARQDD